MSRHSLTASPLPIGSPVAVVVQVDGSDRLLLGDVVAVKPIPGFPDGPLYTLTVEGEVR